jgi:hypothetical protein
MNDRKHLVAAGVDKLIEATKSSRNAARDRCFLLLMFTTFPENVCQKILISSIL